MLKCQNVGARRREGEGGGVLCVGQRVGSEARSSHLDGRKGVIEILLMFMLQLMLMLMLMLPPVGRATPKTKRGHRRRAAASVLRWADCGVCRSFVNARGATTFNFTPHAPSGSPSESALLKINLQILQIHASRQLLLLWATKGHSKNRLPVYK